MHRLGLPKIALVITSRPKKLSFINKAIDIVSFLYKGKAILIAYNDFDVLRSKIDEIGAKEYFLIDELRNIYYYNEDNINVSKIGKEFFENKKIKLVEKSIAEKSEFYVIDSLFQTYWTVT